MRSVSVSEFRGFRVCAYADPAKSDRAHAAASDLRRDVMVSSTCVTGTFSRSGSRCWSGAREQRLVDDCLGRDCILAFDGVPKTVVMIEPVGRSHEAADGCD